MIEIGSYQGQRLVSRRDGAFGLGLGDVCQEDADLLSRIQGEGFHYIVAADQLWKRFGGLSFKTFTQDVSDESTVVRPVVHIQQRASGGEVVG